MTQRACTHDTGSNKDEQVWDMIVFFKKNQLKIEQGRTEKSLHNLATKLS